MSAHDPSSTTFRGSQMLRHDRIGHLSVLSSASMQRRVHHLFEFDGIRLCWIKWFAHFDYLNRRKAEFSVMLPNRPAMSVRRSQMSRNHCSSHAHQSGRRVNAGTHRPAAFAPS